jgi:hypothetical protein
VGGTSERLLAEKSGSKRSRLDSPRVSPWTSAIMFSMSTVT